MAGISRFRPRGSPGKRGAVRRILAPLAAGFRLGIALRAAAYHRGWLKTRRLNHPVVSVGNLTVGGTGKTPFVEFLAGRMLQRGWTPGVLTRGYRRRTAGIFAIEPGPNRTPKPREVGDEPALLARKLPQVAIVVGKDRYRAGRLAEERFNVDVHILDDGFQHFALARDVDIVLLDVTQEIADSALLPAGRAREPWSALKRAHLVVLTRTELGDGAALEARVREVNPQAQVIHSANRFRELVDVSTGRIYPRKAFQGKPVEAFCGIGNPRAFFADLKRWGFSAVCESKFPDHSVYDQGSLAALYEEIEIRKSHPVALLTTEKDAMNLPPLERAGVPILACVIETEVSDPDKFEEALFSRLERTRVNT